MARIGSFSPSQFVVGAPLNIIHPKDNKVPLFDPKIDALEGVSEAEKVRLQEQVDELAAALEAARDLER